MKVKCPECGRKGQAKDTLFNKKIKCPQCSNRFLLKKDVIIVERNSEIKDIVSNTKSTGLAPRPVNPDPQNSKGVIRSKGSAEIKSDKTEQLLNTEVLSNQEKTIPKKKVFNDQTSPPAKTTKEVCHSVPAEEIPRTPQKAVIIDIHDQIAEAPNKPSKTNANKDGSPIQARHKTFPNKCSACATQIDQESSYQLGRGIYCDNCIPQKSLREQKNEVHLDKKSRKNVLTGLFKKKNDYEETSARPQSHDLKVTDEKTKRSTAHAKFNINSGKNISNLTEDFMCAACNSSFDISTAYRLGMSFYCQDCVPTKQKAMVG